MFHASIDDYLELCREIGKEPNREYRGTFNIRVPVELHREAAMEAEAKGISLNQFVTEALRQYVAVQAQ